MSKRITLVVVILALFGSLTACSDSHEQGARFFVNHTARKLDLSDEQKARLFDVAAVALDFRAEMTKDEKQLKRELLTMFHSDELDTNRINVVLAEKEQIFHEYSRLLVANMAEFHSTLTPEQKDKILELMKKSRRRLNRGPRECRSPEYTGV